MSYEQSTPSRNLIGRRQALCTFAGIATAVAGVGLFGIGTAHAAETTTELPSSDTVTAQAANEQAEALAAEQRDLAVAQALVPAGLNVGKWSVESVHAPRYGSMAVVMRTPSGEAFQVDVLRRDPAMAGIAETEHFSLFVANSGDGSKATDEMQARGAMVLAHQLRFTERSGTPIPELLTFRQRANRHPRGEFSVLG
ncbi:hypothetical protein PPSIR1_25661 [Plesiocystis pacifica SIR-1]|uniref:Uncharacterized protein n=1 Tax=Plesiocystis pacifica SIR-1 TaxID=391625 RepID=A6FZE6_9BACT|nr:hypothetical protein PPSIR1_25661 [Plesiocystis pacifica SIR-1]